MADKESGAVTLYVVEEQEIWREIYKTNFSSGSALSLSGISTNRDIRAIKEAVSALNPDVLLIGTKSLTQDFIEEIKQIRAGSPRVGIALLFATYHHEGIKLLRKLAARSEAGMAIYLRQSLERVDQLRQIIKSVSEGHIILDPSLTSLLFTEKHRRMFLKGLSGRELEVLSLVAQGYANQAIAEILYIDIRTVRHHINSMYSKLRADADFDRKHPRVYAARLYLETAGELLIKQAP